MVFDEIGLQNQRFQNRIRFVNFYILYLKDHRLDIWPVHMRVFEKVASHPILETRRFANIKNFSLLIAKLVNEGRFGEIYFFKF